jgi:hypothetical protein
MIIRVNPAKTKKDKKHKEFIDDSLSTTSDLTISASNWTRLIGTKIKIEKFFKVSKRSRKRSDSVYSLEPFQYPRSNSSPIKESEKYSEKVIPPYANDEASVIDENNIDIQVKELEIEEEEDDISLNLIYSTVEHSDDDDDDKDPRYVIG